MFSVSLSKTGFLPQWTPKIACTFSTSKNLLSRYVVVVGGGSSGRTITRLWKENFPELSELKDREKILDHLSEMTPKCETYTAFGRGSYPLADLLLHKFLPYGGPATKERLDHVFDDLSSRLKSQDQLGIVLTGHGHPAKGMQLWNDYFLFNTLRP